MNAVKNNESDLLACMRNVTDLVRQLGRLRRKAVVGGVFGSSGFHLGSVVLQRSGLDVVQYVVLEPTADIVVSSGDTKAGALNAARSVIATLGGPVRFSWCMGLIRAEMQSARDEEEAERKAAAEEIMADRVPKVKSIPRRRRQIFDACGGKCFYCSTSLVLDGLWHVEHKMPKALGGDNSPGNLVASCPPCNYKKRDRTDIEFFQAREASA